MAVSSRAEAPAPHVSSWSRSVLCRTRESRSARPRGRLGSLEQIFRDSQLPPGIFENVIDFDPRMHRCKICLAIFSKAQHGFGGDHRRWPTTRQTDTLAPTGAVAVAWTGTKRNPLGETLLRVFEQNYKSMRE